MSRCRPSSVPTRAMPWRSSGKRRSAPTRETSCCVRAGRNGVHRAAGPSGRGPGRGDDMPNDFELTDDTAVDVISVAAQVCGRHRQAVRAYDRLGLVSPGRSAGRGRRYSLRDIIILREVQRLSQEDGVNLSGIKRILELESEWQRSRIRLAELHEEISQLRAELESTRAVAAPLAGLLRSRTAGGTLVPARTAGTRASRPSGPEGS